MFGSWVKNTQHRNSDIDLAILSHQPLPGGLLATLREQLEESTIPYRVDVVDLSAASPEFQERVNREGIVWIDS
ncbi:MAG: nucleotidyltransferase domain-containing protein [Gemmatimonadaceae bacterium]|nr:nucleotidyltransferase domain-containing protein [Gloeobacterales cyanobacterium ES-bin-141]